MRDQPCRIVIEPECWDAIITAASQRTEKETGGILLGWRHSTGIYVCEAIEIPDRRATRTEYMRRHGPATESLEHFLATLPERSPIGYVGEWHTHLAPQGPSRTDRKQLKRISQHLGDDLALVVAAHDPRSDRWTPQGLCARVGRARPADIDISPTQPDPTTRGDQ